MNLPKSWYILQEKEKGKAVSGEQASETSPLVPGYSDPDRSPPGEEDDEVAPINNRTVDTIIHEESDPPRRRRHISNYGTADHHSGLAHESPMM